MKLPPKKRPGDPVLASDWNILVDALAARTPRRAANSRLVSTSGGFTYLTRPVAGGGGSPQAHPFLLKSGKDDNGNATVTVTPGTVNGMMAGIGGSPLDAEPAPSLEVVAGSNVVYLEITWVPADATDPDGKHYLISGGSLDDLVVKQIANESWPPAETMPEVNDGGGKTDGKFIQRIGRYTAEAGPDGTVVSLVENDTLRHSLNAAFCAPDQFTLTIL